MSLYGMALHWCQPKLTPAHFLQFVLNSGQLLGFTKNRRHPKLILGKELKQWNMSGDLWTVPPAGLHFGPSWGGGFLFFSGKMADCHYKAGFCPVRCYILTRERKMLVLKDFLCVKILLCLLLDNPGAENGGSTTGPPVKGKVAAGHHPASHPRHSWWKRNSTHGRWSGQCTSRTAYIL